MSDSIRVLGEFVLIKQVMKKKTTKLIMDAASDNRDKFDYSFEVIQVGPKCERDIKVGDHPVFSEYVKFSGLKMIEKTENGMISLVIVHENDIIAIDNEAETLTLTDKESKDEHKV